MQIQISLWERQEMVWRCGGESGYFIIWSCQAGGEEEGGSWMWWRRICREVGVTEEDIMDRLRWTPNESSWKKNTMWGFSARGISHSFLMNPSVAKRSKAFIISYFTWPVFASLLWTIIYFKKLGWFK